MRFMISLLPSAAMLAVGTAGAAQLPTLRLTTASAEKIIAGCRAHAEAAKQSHAIAVYDTGGNPVVALRMEGVSPGVMAMATEKAKAASMWGFPTARMQQIAQNLPGFALGPNIMTVGGGVPIFAADGKTLLGGAGASGEASEVDIACLEAGIAGAGLKSARTPG